MHTWPFLIELERESSQPLAVQIAHAIAERIRGGAIRAPQPLPSTRKLSLALGVHRNTVVAAYAELEAEGWIASKQGQATFVSREIPLLAKSLAGNKRFRKTAGFDLPPAPTMPLPELLDRRPGTLELLGGLPDTRLLPSLAIARAYRRVMRNPAYLDYGDPLGHVRLREALASMLGSARGMSLEAEQILITRGAQMALSLVSRALLRPGDVVAVEQMGYPPIWQALKTAGLRLIPVPIDEAGLRIDHLSALLSHERIRAVYLTPHHQYPTTVTLTAARRMALLNLARSKRLLIIEDDYDHELHYQGRPVLPLASADQSNQVVYIGTLSKVLAPGLRLGYIVAPGEAVQRLAAHRYYFDRQGDLVQERAVAQLFQDGEIQRHIWRLRRTCEHRRDALVAALEKYLRSEMTFRVPNGGTAIWCRVSPRMDVDAWASRAWKRGVAVQTSRYVSLDSKPSTHLRLGFARHNEQELEQAVRRLAECRQ